MSKLARTILTGVAAAVGAVVPVLPAPWSYIAGALVVALAAVGIVPPHKTVV